MAKSNWKLINLRIPDALAREMPEYDEVNWSAVMRKAIEDRIKKEQKTIRDHGLI